MMRVFKVTSIFFCFFMLNLLLVAISTVVFISSIAEHGENMDFKYAKIIIALTNGGDSKSILAEANIKIKENLKFDNSVDNVFTSKKYLESILMHRLNNEYNVFINPQNGDGWFFDKKIHHWISIPQLTIAPNSIFHVIPPIACIFIFVNFVFWWLVVRPLNKVNAAIIKFQRTGFPTKIIPHGSLEMNNIISNINLITFDTYKASQERSLMLSSIVHDLKSPLTRIQLRSEFVEDCEIQKGLVNDCIFMDKLIQQIINYFHRSSFSKLVAVDDVCRRISSYPEFENNRVKFNLNLSKFILLPELELERILINLIKNAIEYGKPPVICSTTLVQNTIEISVLDHGVGISKQNWNFALRPFVRLDKYRPHGIPHSGLGLASVAKLVTFLEGSISQSYPSNGFCITLSFPVNHINNYY